LSLEGNQTIWKVSCWNSSYQKGSIALNILGVGALEAAGLERQCSPVTVSVYCHQWKV